jgi:hypothetical protein
VVVPLIAVAITLRTKDVSRMGKRHSPIPSQEGGINGVEDAPLLDISSVQKKARRTINGRAVRYQYIDHFWHPGGWELLGAA